MFPAGNSFLPPVMAWQASPLSFFAPARHGLRYPGRGQRCRRFPLQPPRRLPLVHLQRANRFHRLRPPVLHWCYIDSAASIRLYLKPAPCPTSPEPLPATFSPSSEPFWPGFAPALLSWVWASSSPALEFFSASSISTSRIFRPIRLASRFGSVPR